MSVHLWLLSPGCNLCRILLLPCSLCDSSPVCSNPVFHWRPLTLAHLFCRGSRGSMLMKSVVQLDRALWMACGHFSCLCGDYPLCWIQLYLLCRLSCMRKVYIGCILGTTRWTRWALISNSGWASTVAGRSSSGLKLISQVPSSASGFESSLSRVKPRK